MPIKLVLSVFSKQNGQTGMKAFDQLDLGNIPVVGKTNYQSNNI